MKIPESTPSCERCTFAWTWVNAVGNREFYMNCADIKIRGSGDSVLGTRMVVANLPGYPRIPEFSSTTYDGKDIYDNAKKLMFRRYK